jgi:hypothetical protein
VKHRIPSRQLEPFAGFRFPPDVNTGGGPLVAPLPPLLTATSKNPSPSDAYVATERYADNRVECDHGRLKALAGAI